MLEHFMKNDFFGDILKLLKMNCLKDKHIGWYQRTSGVQKSNMKWQELRLPIHFYWVVQGLD